MLGSRNGTEPVARMTASHSTICVPPSSRSTMQLVSADQLALAAHDVDLQALGGRLEVAHHLVDDTLLAGPQGRNVDDGRRRASRP